MNCSGGWKWRMIIAVNFKLENLLRWSFFTFTLSYFTYIIVSGHSSLKDDILFSSLKWFINKTSMRCAITNSKFPRFLIHRNIWYLSGDVEVQVVFVGLIWIQSWIIIVWKVFRSINNFQNYNLISTESARGVIILIYPWLKWKPRQFWPKRVTRPQHYYNYTNAMQRDVIQRNIQAVMQLV